MRDILGEKGDCHLDNLSGKEEAGILYGWEWELNEKLLVKMDDVVTHLLFERKTKVVDSVKPYSVDSFTCVIGTAEKVVQLMKRSM